MRLYVETIETEVSQVFKPTKNVMVGALRPHLFIKNNPSGTLKVQITTEDDTLVAESEAIQISDITDATYYHGYVRFYINAYLRENTKYKFKVVAGGSYSFSEPSHCAVVRDYYTQRYERINPVTHPSFAALDFEVWSYSLK